jgi:hypothetical protein
MGLYLTTSGRRVTPEFPDDLRPWPELDEAVATARRLEREFHEASSTCLEAEAKLQAAVAEDRARVADARLAGQKKLPPARGVEAARAACAEAERQRDASDDARRRGAEIVVEKLEQHRAEYVRAAETVVDATRADEASALNAYLAALESNTTARETLAWLRDFPEKRGYRPNTAPLRYVGRREAIPFSDVVYGLRVRCGLADPPARTLAEHVRASGETPAPEITGSEAIA